ncbi:MAG: hypothetical protein V3V10_09280, partial [Planctomycetota bacterium]
RDTGLRLLGATRGYVSTGLWLRAGESYRRGDYFETLATYQLIRELQPRNPAVYSYLGWNQAYNISPQFPTRDRQFEWLARGFKTLQDGQSELPDDSSLHQDEWNFLLFKSSIFPLRLIELLTPRHDDPAFALVVERMLELRDELSTENFEKLEEFLGETGMHLMLFEHAELLMSIPQEDQLAVLDLAVPLPKDLAEFFPETNREQLRELMTLNDEIKPIIALAHWARLHLMALTLESAMEIQPRSLSADTNILNSYRLAVLNCPAQIADNFKNTYRMAVVRLYKLGIENAQKHGGTDLVTEFKAHMQENFEELPGWLPE